MRNILIGLCAAVCLAQSPQGPDISAYYRLTPQQIPLYKWLRVDPPLTVTVDAQQAPHLGISLPFITVTGPDHILQQAFLDTSYVTYRTQPPSGPGACNEGTGAWAADGGFFYLCVPNGFIWARTALSTNW